MNFDKESEDFFLIFFSRGRGGGGGGGGGGGRFQYIFYVFYRILSEVNQVS